MVHLWLYEFSISFLWFFFCVRYISAPYRIQLLTNSYASYSQITILKNARRQQRGIYYYFFYLQCEHFIPLSEQTENGLHRVNVIVTLPHIKIKYNNQ